MGKDTKTIEEQLNRDFNSLWFPFTNGLLIVNLDTISFGTKGHLKNQKDLNIKYSDIKIKQQYDNVPYLMCIFDNNLSREPIATKALGLVNG